MRHAREDVLRVLLAHKADPSNAMVYDAHTPGIVKQLVAVKVPVNEACFGRYVNPECPAIDQFSEPNVEVRTIRLLFAAARKQREHNPWKNPIRVLLSSKQRHVWSALTPCVVKYHLAPFLWAPPTILSEKHVEAADALYKKLNSTTFRDIKRVFQQLRGTLPADMVYHPTNPLPSETSGSDTEEDKETDHHQATQP